MLPMRTLAAAVLVSCLTASRGEDPARRSARTFAAEQFPALHRLIQPQAGEARWEQVPWMPSTDIWAARRKAAEEGKPVLLWYMAGEPLGTC